MTESRVYLSEIVARGGDIRYLFPAARQDPQPRESEESLRELRTYNPGDTIPRDPIERKHGTFGYLGGLVRKFMKW